MLGSSGKMGNAFPRTQGSAKPLILHPNRWGLGATGTVQNIDFGIYSPSIGTYLYPKRLFLRPITLNPKPSTLLYPYWLD